MNTNNNNNSHLETSTTQKITTPHQTERNNPHTEDLDQSQCTDGMEKAISKGYQPSINTANITDPQKNQ